LTSVSQFLTALSAEFEARQVAKAAGRARHLELASTFHAELGAFRVFKLAFWALHFFVS
jgi:hypothetical protein